MDRLYRSMKEDPHGFPVVAPNARGLGVRPGKDIAGIHPCDVVHPSQGGLSVSPDDPMGLPYYRRPPALQGTGQDPVWEIEASQLGPNLVYRQDPANAGHGFVEPARSMTLDEYQQALKATQSLWKKTT
jgi:hypothetical protein